VFALAKLRSYANADRALVYIIVDGFERQSPYHLLVVPDRRLQSTVGCRSGLGDAWLDPENKDTGDLSALPRPIAPANWTTHAVSRRVNSPRNDGPELIDAVAASSE
jgi:hypothetical protein